MVSDGQFEGSLTGLTGPLFTEDFQEIAFEWIETYKFNIWKVVKSNEQFKWKKYAAMRAIKKYRGRELYYDITNKMKGTIAGILLKYCRLSSRPLQRANIPIKWFMWIFWFPSAYKTYVYTVL